MRVASVEKQLGSITGISKQHNGLLKDLSSRGPT